ncbi:MAG TPA: branched-chain amino acid ABC transporter permease [Candidatus Paceibacterota bacterium]
MEIFVQLLLNGLIAGSLYSLLAIGFNLFYGTVKFFDLAFGTIALVGSYATLSFLKNLDLPLLISVMGGILVGAVLNVIIYKLVYVPIRARKGSNMVLLVTSLGVFTILQSLLAILFSSQFQTLRSAGYVPHIFHIYGASVTSVQVLMIALAVLVPIVMHFILKRTKFGRAVRAIGDNEEVASIVGINTSKVIGGVFFISAALSGLAGIMNGLDRGIEPYMGLALLLKGIIAAIVGGIGYLWGGVLGGFVLGLIENFGTWYLPSEWKDAIAFVVLIIFLIFRPRGILSK